MAFLPVLFEFCIDRLSDAANSESWVIGFQLFDPLTARGTPHEGGCSQAHGNKQTISGPHSRSIKP